MPPTSPTLVSSLRHALPLSSLKHALPVSDVVSSLSRRAAADAITPLASVFALIIREPSSIHIRSLSALLSSSPSSSPSSPLEDTLFPISPSLSGIDSATLNKRQLYVLAIPTTYAGLNAGPSPGIVVAIMLCSIAGFLLVGFVFLLLARFYTTRVVEEKEVIVRSSRRRSTRSRSRSRSRSEHISPARPSRRRSTRVVEEVIQETRPAPTQLTVEEEEEVVVEEEPEDEPDIVEVIEEHSPEPTEVRRESRRESKRSGFRTVDPAEYGGGDAPRRSFGRI